MKTSIKLLLATLLAFAAHAAGARTIEMHVNGLVCAFCAQGIEKQFRGMPETADVYVSLEHHVVAVALKDGSDIGDEALKTAITDSGFALVTIARTDRSLDDVRAAAGGDGD